MSIKKYSTYNLLANMPAMAIAEPTAEGTYLHVLIIRDDTGSPIYSEELQVVCTDRAGNLVPVTSLNPPGVQLMETHMAGGATANAFYMVKAGPDLQVSVSLRGSSASFLPNSDTPGPVVFNLDKR